tara:strand:- start:420 stop:803 length:384 start_codon:yes stop_codon:yes gene_type:complete
VDPGCAPYVQDAEGREDQVPEGVDPERRAAVEGRRDEVEDHDLEVRWEGPTADHERHWGLEANVLELRLDLDFRPLGTQDPPDQGLLGEARREALFAADDLSAREPAGTWDLEGDAQGRAPGAARIN